MSWSLLAFILAFSKVKTANISYHQQLDNILQQVNTLHLHLDNTSDAENPVVEYLLQQQHSALCISSVNQFSPSLSSLNNYRHHFFLYSDVSELNRRRRQFRNRGGYYFFALTSPNRLTAEERILLLRFAEELWQEQSLYKVYYIFLSEKPETIYFYNPFWERTNGLGTLILVDLDKHDRPTYVMNNLYHYKVRVYMFDGVYSTLYGDPVTQEVHNVTGPDSMALHLLSDKMNFTIDFQWPDDEFYGARLEDGSFNGAIGRILHNDMDIIFTGFFIKDYLTSDIEFSVAVYMDKLCCYVQKAKRIPQSILPLFAVQPDVWLVFILVGFASVLMWIGIRALNFYLKIKRIKASVFGILSRGKWTQCKRIFLDTWVVWVRVNINQFPPFHSERVFVASLCLVSVIFGALLESSLATVYIRPMYYKDINTLGELDESNLKIYIKHPAFKDDLFYGHGSKVYQNLDSKMFLVAEYDDRLINMISKLGTFAGVTRSAALTLSDIRYIMLKKVHKIPECPKDYNIAYVLRRYSPFSDIMNILLLRINEAGLINEWIDETEEQAKISVYSNPELVAESTYIWKELQLNDVQLAFYALLVGCAFALLVLFVEWAQNVFYVRRQKLFRP